MIDFFRNIKFFIRNLIYWLPILWDDRDWDYNYMLRILIHKLNGMERLFREHGHLENSEEVANEIQSVVHDLSIVEGGLLDQVAYAEHERKWGEVSFEYLPTNNQEFFELRMNYPSAITQKQAEEAQADLMRLAKQADEDTFNLLLDAFTRMGEQLQGWWD